MCGRWSARWAGFRRRGARARMNRSRRPSAAPPAIAAGSGESSGSGEPLDALLHRAFGFAGFPRQSGRSLPDGDRGARRAAGDAHGRGQIALLPTARACARRHDAGDQSADRADGRPVSKAAGTWLRGGVHPFRTRPRGVAPGLYRLPERQAAVPVHRAGAPARARLSGDAGEAETDADCDRRSALHFAMGTRFSARLPAAGQLSADAAPGAGDRADSHGHGDGAA